MAEPPRLAQGACNRYALEMAQTVRKAFAASADSDDRGRRKLIPCFDDFYRTALELPPFAPDAGFEVLDLGAGTGILSAMIAAAFPKARLTLFDLTPEMLIIARARLKPLGKRVRFSGKTRTVTDGPSTPVVNWIIAAPTRRELELLQARLARFVVPTYANYDSDQGAGPSWHPFQPNENPLQRAGSPEDVAGAVLWLLRDATFVTGQIIYNAGGQRGPIRVG